MKAFISYSHANSGMLEILHKHLAQLQRDRLISAWSDNEIPAGGMVDKNISAALGSSYLFIALLSPDYIASQYCYDKEFQKAMEMQEEGKLIIVPVVIEPCDWLNTPFKQFKALPKDGKPVSEWQNINTAFLDITQNLRKLIASGGIENEEIKLETKSATSPSLRNYRVKQDFDSIQKMEFVEKTFEEVGAYIKNYIQEIILIDNIKARVTKDAKGELEYLLVNRNKIKNNESQLKIIIGSSQSNMIFNNSSETSLVYSISEDNGRRTDQGKSFNLVFDEYHMFWKQSDFYSGSRESKEFNAKDIADSIWNEWLESVGIV